MNLQIGIVDQQESAVEFQEQNPENTTPANTDDGFKRNRTEGFIIQCDGEMAVVTATAGKSISASDDYWTVGQLISVIVGDNRIVGLIYRVEAPTNAWENDGDNQINIHIELVGEIVTKQDGKISFNSGISTYPHLGAVAHRIRTADLAAIYENNDDTTVTIGSITQDDSIPALITIDKLLSRHFAVVGTTGVGKSTSVALILRKIVTERPDIRVLILDPHNEYATAFPRHAMTVDAASLDLPFWMFTMEEFVEVIYRGRPGIGAEIDALRDLIPEAKIRYELGVDNEKSASLVKRGRTGTAYTSDTPVPYRMQDMLKLIDEKVGQLEGKVERPHLKALKNRIESIMNDPRFKFMFEGNSNGDAMNRVLSHVFRIPQNGTPICVFELSGLPSEVVNVVASVMCRLAFDLGMSSKGAIQTLVVCEEAHRYIPADSSAGFLPTRQAISRIAKEGRKYGVYLGVITQRPGELDATILSQCNTVFAMRLGNESDKKIVRQAISGAANSTASFLSSLANRECIAFGEAIDSPMRMMFETVAKEDLPGSHIYENQAKIRDGSVTVSLSSVVRSMRQQDKNTVDTQAGDLGPFQNVSKPTNGEQRPSTADAPQIYKDIQTPTPALSPVPSSTPPAKYLSTPPMVGNSLEVGSRPGPTPSPVPANPRENIAEGRKNADAGNLIRSFRTK